MRHSAGEIHRHGLPRSDLKVTLEGVAIKPALALGGWVAFATMHGEAMLMGDLVLLETEITPVMTKIRRPRLRRRLSQSISIPPSSTLS